jgi:hypothetical protein
MEWFGLHGFRSIGSEAGPYMHICEERMNKKFWRIAYIFANFLLLLSVVLNTCYLIENPTAWWCAMHIGIDATILVINATMSLLRVQVYIRKGKGRAIFSNVESEQNV